MDFRSEGTRRSVNLLAFLQRVLKAEQSGFQGENRSGFGAVQTIDSILVLLLKGTVNSELKILQMAQNTTCEVKRRQFTVSKTNTTFI